MFAVLEGRALPVFPCWPNKRPACVNGFKDASTEPGRVMELWNWRKGLLVGVPTGEVSGIAVLDVDLKGMSWLEANGLPATRRHRTRSGGFHFIYKHRPGLRCSRSEVAPGIDVRGEGGYVIWWTLYGFEVEEREVAEWPDGLVTDEKVSRVVEPSGIRTIHEEVTYVRNVKQTAARWSPEESHALVSAKRTRDRIAHTLVGARQKTINAEAYALGRQVARGWISGHEALLWLWLGAQECKFVREHGEEQTLRAICGGLRDGMKVPYPDLRVRPEPIKGDGFNRLGVMVK